MVTLVTLRKLVPVIVTLVPPARGPVPGSTAVTVSSGGGGGGATSLQPSVTSVATRLPTSIAIALMRLIRCRSWAPPPGRQPRDTDGRGQVAQRKLGGERRMRTEVLAELILR